MSGYREVALDFWGEVCQKCGDENGLEVHHRDRYHDNKSVLNLMVLCRGCHAAVHGGGNWKGDRRPPHHYKALDKDSSATHILNNPSKAGKKRVDSNGRLYLGKEFAGEVVAFGIEETELKESAQ